MKLKRHGILAGVVLTATLALAACGTDDNTTPGTDSTSAAAGDCATGKLTAQGSTAQKNAMDQWIKDYAAKCSGASIDYQGTGSGAGIQAFTAGTADFAGSDSALKDEEKPGADARCGTGNSAIHLPLVIGPVAVVYNLDGVTNLQLSPATLAKIFSYQATTWNDPAIAADNPGVTLPGTAILAIHRADSSGTTDNFTKYLSKTAAADWTFGNAKEWPLKEGGQGETKSDGVASAVKANKGAIGYVEWSFAQVNGLTKAKVKNGAGEYTELTAESAGKTIESAKVTGTGDDLKLDIDYNTTAPGAYPIVLVTYEIVCGKGTPADKLALVKGFLAHAAGDGQTALTKLGYAPLPATVADKVKTAITNLA
ncbi:phosphate ABC transporter substrate-binding protein PstS [Luedemannella helvata]|uniref:Phosphate-binding protein n=1 Tax=Luedemannella helvata TaxID=349315 RepID=A0ABP4VPS7_9ACTN